MPIRRLALLLCAASAATLSNRWCAAESIVTNTAGIAAAIAAARPGDTVILADGRYEDLGINFRGTGVEGRPITLRAQTPGKVTLTGKASVEMRGAWLVLDGLRFEQTTTTPLMLRNTQHCRVTNCAIIRCNPPSGRLHWIRVAGPTSWSNRIDHCYTVGKLTDGVVLTIEGDDGKMPLDTLIDHNHFKEVVRAVRNGMETIRVGTSEFGQLDSRTVVESNLFEGCSGDAEIISSKSCGNLYRWNTFRGCDGAVTMRHGHRSAIEGNFFFGGGGSRTAGIRVHGSDHRVVNNYLEAMGQFGISLPAGDTKFTPAGHEPTSNCLIAHNTIVEPLGPAIVLGTDLDEKGRGVAPSGSIIANNLVVTSRGKLVESLFVGPTTWQGNVFFARPGVPAGDLPAAGVRLTDPQLGGAEDGLWRPGPLSPLLGAAVALRPPVTQDLDGQPRGARPDVGADQRSGEARVRKPLLPEDVGLRY